MEKTNAVTSTGYIILMGLLFSLAAAMIYYPMCFGLVEDAQNLLLVRTAWQHLSLFQILRDYSYMDAGTFKPIYLLFVYFCYGTFQSHPKLFYLINYAIVLLAMMPWALLIRRHAATRFRQEWTLFYCFLLLVAIPLYNLTTHLVLIEKLVIFFAGWASYVFDQALTDQNKSDFRWWALQSVVFVLVVCGFWSKPTFIAFMPWFILAIALSKTLPARHKWGVLGVFLATTAVMGYSRLSNRSSYNAKDRTDLPGPLERIHGLPRSYYLLFGLGLFN